MGIFIQISTDNSIISAGSAQSIALACPMEIYGVNNGQLTVRAEEEDECTLCKLCLEISPVGSITIRKTYKDEHLSSTGVEN